MGTNNSKQSKGHRRNFSSQSISTELDNSSSSYYSNYEQLRQVNEGNCLACNIKKSSKPNWLKFYHAKCDKMIMSNIPWAYEGKQISEFRGKTDYRSQYDQVFQANLKKIKTIISHRPSVHEEQDAPQNMNNLLADLNITTNENIIDKKGANNNQQQQQSQQSQNSKYKMDATPKQRKSEKNFGSNQSSSNNENEFYSVKSDLMSNPTPLSNNIHDQYKQSGKNDRNSNYQSCRSNNNQRDDQNTSGYLYPPQTNSNQNNHNNSFPSYMLENQFQGLRAGNTTMLNINDPELQRKNLNFYFECTSVIGQHLDDENFTLHQIRLIFITSFYARYSEKIKVHRELLAQQRLTQQQNDDQKRNLTQESNEFSQQYQQYKQRNSIPVEPSTTNNNNQRYQDNPQEQNEQNQYIYNNISSYRFSCEEKFSPLQDAFHIYKNALREFQYFVKIYMEVVKQYYDIHYKKNQNMNDGLKKLFSYHNFQNFIISKLFQNEKIPKILIELIKLVIPDDKDLISQIDRTKLTPQMFGIPSQYSLDEETKKLLGVTPYTSSDAFGSIKEEFEEYDEKSLHNINKNADKQIAENNPQTDQNAINNDFNSHNNNNNSFNHESNPSSKYNSQQKTPIHHNFDRNDPKAIQTNKRRDEEEEEQEENEEDQDIIFELRITNKAKTQFTQYYQQSDLLRGNSNIFSSEQTSQIKKEIEKDLQADSKKVNPYQKCIDYIEQMKNSTTPTGKFKAIIQACESIEKCIIEFYKQNGRNFNYTIDEETQTGYTGLEAHCKFVNSFYKNPTKKMKLKYYLIAFEIALRNMHELYYHKIQQQQQNQAQNGQQINTATSTQDNSIDSTKSPQSILKKNLTRRLSENFDGLIQNPGTLKNITGKHSIFKQTLAESKY